MDIGARLGAYEVIAKLGAGGMGAVYRARDTRLQRDVAIKVVAADGAGDPSRLARFEQEARATAALNHPHIVAVHDIGHGPHGPFIVSELLEGETLRERLARGRLPAGTALDIGAQIARGLAAAHDKGIVHRDLKPENIFLTRDGTAKILDFGLAKLRDAQTVADGAQTATATMAMPARTEAGVVLGTVGYMAPEQVRGESADARTDLFALGCVLHEMLSGQRAFAGASSIETLHAILTAEPPDLTELGVPATPPAVQRLLRRALDKDPSLRFQSARDLAFALDTLMVVPTSMGGPVLERQPSLRQSTPGAPRRTREYLAWSVAAAALAAAVALAVTSAGRTAPPPSPVRAYLFHQEYAFVGQTFALSPDGTRLAFVAGERQDRAPLRVRLLSGLADQPFAGTEGAMLPFWSPDGQHVAFFADGKLKRVGLAGGPVQTLADAPLGRGGAWNQHGEIVFAPDRLGGLMHVPAAGGGAQPATVAVNAIETHRTPWFLPDGRRYLFVRALGNLGVGVMTEQEIRIGTLGSTETRTVMPSTDNSSVAYAPPGFLLFRREFGLYAQRFDAEALQVSGSPVRLAESVTAGLADGAHFAVSHTGTLAYRESGGGADAFTLGWYSRDGVLQAGQWAVGDYLHPRLSPDGTRVAFISSETGEVWVQDLARGARTRMTFDDGRHTRPVWSPDGRRLAFACERAGSSAIHVADVPGGGGERVLVASADIKMAHAWSPDGRYVMYQNITPAQAGADLWVVAADGATPPAVWRTDSFWKASPVFSPDGRWVAYVSTASRRDEVHIAQFPGPGPAEQVSVEGGTDPMWRADGRELFFIGPERLMSVTVEPAGDSLRLGIPGPLFKVPDGAAGNAQVAADGRRFLLRARAEQAASNGRYVLVTNWPAALGQR